MVSNATVGSAPSGDRFRTGLNKGTRWGLDHTGVMAYAFECRSVVDGLREVARGSWTLGRAAPPRIDPFLGADVMAPLLQVPARAPADCHRRSLVPTLSDDHDSGTCMPRGCVHARVARRFTKPRWTFASERPSANMVPYLSQRQ